MSFFISENLKNVLDEKTFASDKDPESEESDEVKKRDNYNVVVPEQIFISFEDILYQVNKINYTCDELIEINFICNAFAVYNFLIKEINTNKIEMRFGKGRVLKIDSKQVKVKEVCRRFEGNCYTITIVIDKEYTGV